MGQKLLELINKYGEPDALIDHWGNNDFGYAIWGFNDTIEWDSKHVAQTDKQIKQSLHSLQSRLNDWKHNDNEISAIGFINYNFKNILYNHISFKTYDSDIPYLFFGQPRLIKKYKIESANNRIINVKLKKDLEPVKDYKKKIKKIKSELKKGNVYQINYTNNKSYYLENSAFELYLSLRNNIKPKYGYYIKYNDIYLLSFSPELFFMKENNTIKTAPMKGTRKRSINSKKDKQLKLELKNSIKDRAEHLMIVDLLRNDLGKIAIPGSIKVNDIFKIESFNTVHQMISNITAKLCDEITEVDIIESLFPGGSITGAPKESAMKIIDELEDYSRDIYTGSIGYIKSNGDLNFNIAIRTMTVNKENGEYPVGGGIVWDSNADDEWDEAQLKSKIINDIIK